MHEKLYRGAGLSVINARDYIEGLARELSVSLADASSGTLVGLDLRAEPLELDIDTLIPCGLILNELVTNSFKHAFAGMERGMVGVTLSAREGSLVEMRIWDNGRGFDVDLCRQKGCLGLSIVDTLAAQIEGKAEITSSHDGTSCTVRFPYPGQ